MLGTAIGVRMEVDRIEPWSSDLDDKLDASLEALRAQDSGDDVDFVVGLIGALPKETDNLQALGDITPLGKHIILRSADLLAEQQAIDTAFTRLSDEERARYAKQHRDHRALVTFLHAIGRCLGAVDERDPRSLMNQFYRRDAMAFGPGSIALMGRARGRRSDAYRLGADRTPGASRHHRLGRRLGRAGSRADARIPAIDRAMGSRSTRVQLGAAVRRTGCDPYSSQSACVAGGASKVPTATGSWARFEL